MLIIYLTEPFFLFTVVLLLLLTIYYNIIVLSLSIFELICKIK